MKVRNDLREVNLPRKKHNQSNNVHTKHNNNFWKNALNLNSDLHDPWINLFKRLYGEDYFDRIRSLSKSKAETAILNVGGERHEVAFQTLARLPDTRLAKLRSAKSQAELNLLCDRCACMSLTGYIQQCLLPRHTITSVCIYMKSYLF